MRTRISRLEQAHTKAQLWQTEVCGLSHATCCCAQEVVHCRSCVLRNVCLQAGCVLASLQQAKAVLEKNVNRRQQGRGHTLVSSLGDKAVNQASPLRLTGPKASCESTAPASRESTFSRASCESNFSRASRESKFSREEELMKQTKHPYVMVGDLREGYKPLFHQFIPRNGLGTHPMLMAGHPDDQEGGKLFRTEADVEEQKRRREKRSSCEGKGKHVRRCVSPVRNPFCMPPCKKSRKAVQDQQEDPEVMNKIRALFAEIHEEGERRLAQKA